MILKPSKINTYPQMFINCFPLKCFPVAAYSLFLQTLFIIKVEKSSTFRNVECFCEGHVARAVHG